MLRVLIAEAEVERPPDEIAGHPAVRKQAKALGKRPTELLLDQNVHRQALKQLDDGARRGRPDIAHLTLLTLLESPLAKAGGLKAALHTRNGELVRLRPDTRLPRGEARFQGLLAKVLMEGASQAKDPLVWVEATCTPQEALASFARGPVVRLDEQGPLQTPDALAAKGQDLTLVLGGFPSGDWSPAWRQAAPGTAAIWPAPLNAWAVAAECVCAFRARWGPERPPG